MKKKLFRLLLILCLILGLSLAVAAEDDLFSGKCGEDVTWHLDVETSTLTISGTGKMYDYNDWKYDCAPWYQVPGYDIHVDHVIIEDGVTYIGNNALISHIEGHQVYMGGDVTIPASVVQLGASSVVEGGFSRYQMIHFLGSMPQMSGSIYGDILHICYPADDESWLEARTMDYGDTYIFWIATDRGNGTYSGYDDAGNSWSLDSNGHLQMEGSAPVVTLDGANMVYPWSHMKDKIITAALSEEMNLLMNQCFADCVNLKSIYIPDSVEYIFNNALQNCITLEEVVLPDSVVEIHDLAFDGCSGLTEITMPKNLRMLTNGVFRNCTGLEQIAFRGNAPQIAESINEYPGSFEGLNATVYYPAGDATWTSELLKDYGGSIRWKSYSGDTPPAYEPSPEAPFSDVKSGDYFFDPVLWAVDNGITTGTSATTFSPDAPCTRGQVVTFLWRAAGSPQQETTKNRFTDVKKGDYYYDAVQWAVEYGITTGTSDTTFSPDAPCTRAQVATFLWRTAGQPEAESPKHSFTDIKKDYYYDAVLWAVEFGITNGTSTTTFSPNDTCSRAQIVTFLHRFLG